MATSPVLILGYNRPSHIRRLITSLEVSAPPKIIFCVDGPRSKQDELLVNETRDAVSLISWTNDVECIFRESNFGLRNNIESAVTYAADKFGQVIVLEDDVEVGSQAIPFMEDCLIRFRDEPKIMHINGYNLVPPNHLGDGTCPIHYTRYIESYAWATWQSSWSLYDAGLNWALQSTIAELANALESSIAAIRWRINFNDAATERISSWAYRWLASIWSQGGLAVGPNSNLVSYHGQTNGTHTYRKPHWEEIPIDKNFSMPKDSDIPELVADASDDWVGRTVFREHPWGLIDGFASSIALEILKRYKKSRSS